jgi:hypothetical protein
MSWLEYLPCPNVRDITEKRRSENKIGQLEEHFDRREAAVEMFFVLANFHAYGISAGSATIINNQNTVKNCRFDLRSIWFCSLAAKN